MSEIVGQHPNGLLTDEGIRIHRSLGNVVIEPYDERQLGTTSYDVRLDKWFYRESETTGIYNMRSEKSVLNTWKGPFQAEKASDVMKRIGPLENFSEDDEIIMLEPGESILACTVEFIGSRRLVLPSMQARSTIGRSFLVACNCAGWGDIGYMSKWTMEITNRSLRHTIPLRVGMRFAQISFVCTEGTDKNYITSGNYQKSSDLNEIMTTWKCSDMLPKMYQEWELGLNDVNNK